MANPAAFKMYGAVASCVAGNDYLAIADFQHDIFLNRKIADNICWPG